MRRGIIYLVISCFFCGCATTTSRQATGTMVGMQLGSVIGGAVGSMSSHSPRGHFFGTAVGAVTGAAIGNAMNAPKRQHNDVADAQGEYSSRKAAKQAARRAEIEHAVAAASQSSSVQVANVVFWGDAGGNRLTADGYARLSFDIINNGGSALRYIYPLVQCDNKRIEISSMTAIENLASGDGVRYTVTLHGDSRLKTGNATLAISLAVGDGDYCLMHKLRILTEK